MSLLIHELFLFGTEALITSAKSVAGTTVLNTYILKFRFQSAVIIKWGDQGREELRRPRFQSGILRISLLRDFQGGER